MTLSVVVVAYDSARYLPACLASVVGAAAELIVVDNASPAPEAELVRREFPAARVIELPRNHGFGRAANAGVLLAASPWVLLLNPDAWALGDAVERLVEFAEADPRLGAVGPRLEDPSGRPARSAIRAPLGPAPLALWAALPAPASAAYSLARRVTGAGAADGVAPEEFLEGAAMLLRREAFEQVGGFDEDFFMYAEDADLIGRLRGAGWRVAIAPEARFAHAGSGSSGGSRLNRELLRSWLRLIDKRDGRAASARSRRWLLAALRLRAPLDGEARATARWLASQTVADLLEVRRA